MKIRNAIKKGLAILALAGAVAVNYNPSPFNFEEKYAVLINGSDEQEFCGMERIIYERIEEIGFEKKNIYTLQDQKGKEITKKQMAKDIFSELERKVDENDFLVINLIGHGNRIEIPKNGKTRELSAAVLGNEYFDEDEIYESISKIRPKIGVMITDTCYGGGIAKKFGEGNFIGISSSGENETSIYMFSQSFITEFYASLMDRDADANNDGKITIKEAFDYAKYYFDVMSEKSRRTPVLVSGINPDSITVK